VSHNGNIVPLRHRYLLVAAYYQGGNTVVDFTDVENPREMAYSDINDDLGATDSWSTYWYNGYAYVNGGLDRVAGSSNRGFEAYRIYNPWGTRLVSRNWRYLNPQTQEVHQMP
jgi:hypothetical protein